MLKKLRTKLTLITMSMVTFVLLVTLGAILISNYQKNVSSTRTALETALENASNAGNRTGHSDSNGFVLNDYAKSEGDAEAPAEPSSGALPDAGSPPDSPAESSDVSADSGFSAVSPDASAAPAGSEPGTGSDDAEDPSPKKDPSGGQEGNIEPDSGIEPEDTDEDFHEEQAEFGKKHENGAQQENYTPTMVITINSDGTLEQEYANLAVISEDNLSDITEAILASGKTAGVLREYSLRYQTQENEDGSTRIALADRSHESSQLWSLLRSCLLIGIPMLAILFFVSLFLSDMALKPVKKALEQQKQFVANASHELKTPLTVILANNEILRSHASETVSSQTKWIDSTKEEGDHMKKLIEDLLFLAKSDAAKLPTNLVETSLSDLIEGTVLTFEPVAFENGITTETEVEPDLTAMADETQIRQLVMILLDNACKYAGKNGTITIKLSRSGNNALFTVNNTGDAIPAESLPHLFERFYRVDSSRQKETGGHGLGLSIAATIAEIHKGTITVTSTEKEGTTFTVTLPLK